MEIPMCVIVQQNLVKNAIPFAPTAVGQSAPAIVDSIVEYLKNI